MQVRILFDADKIPSNGKLIHFKELITNSMSILTIDSVCIFTDAWHWVNRNCKTKKKESFVIALPFNNEFDFQTK